MSPRSTSHSFTLLPSSILSLSTLSYLLLSLPSPAQAFDCNAITASGVNFNFKELGGPHIVHWEEEPDVDHQTQFKYNFTLDICNTLKKGDLKTHCHPGTRICAIREEVDLTGNRDAIIQPIEIAGTYTTQGNRNRVIDPKFELLRDSKSHSDSEREGLRAELHGGRFPFDDSKNGQEQQAIIEFVCDKDRTGLEGSEDGEKNTDDGKDDKDDGGKKGDDKDDGGKKGDEKDDDGKKKEDKEERLRRREDDKKDGDKKSLRFLSYKVEDGKKDKKDTIKTLRLEWRTKHACEDAPDDTASSHWGFFTWTFIIVFLAIAAYLIFGSWLNYNRYGARGWDLLPHGDTLRDIPYILKDCGRRVKDTVQGSGSRGGYSAV